MELTNDLQQAGASLRKGELVIFPTETVYGIGANALSNEAAAKIFIAKGRASDNPLIVHIADKSMINQFAVVQNEIENKLIDTFMPGPFTIILKKKENIGKIVSGGLDTVGIRMPDHEIAQALINEAGVPIAAPSANISGRPSGTNIEDIDAEFNNTVSYIIDGGESMYGVESTVVQVLDGIPVILRPGAVTDNDIKKAVGSCKLVDSLFKETAGPVLSPGMKYRHYAPSAPCVLIKTESLESMQEEVSKIKTENSLIIGFTEYQNAFPNNTYLSFGSIQDYKEISHNIFKLLRQAEKYNPDKIIIMGVNKEGIGVAIMNRLMRACEFNYIERSY